MGTAISLVNFKGGVGKTTLAVNFAACLAKEYRKKVLLVDIDPQSNASLWLLGLAKWKRLATRNNLNKTSFSLFFRDRWLYIRPYNDPDSERYLPDLCLLPSSYHLLALEEQIFKNLLSRRMDDEYDRGDEYKYAEKSLRELKDKFDYIVIDCPPNIYNATKNVLVNSDYVVVPSAPDSLSTMGLRLLFHRLESVVWPLVKLKKLASTPVVLGVAMMRYQANLREHTRGKVEIEAALEDYKKKVTRILLNDKTLFFGDYPVRERTDHQKAVSACLPLCLYSPRSQAYSDIQSLTQAIVEALEGK